MYLQIDHENIVRIMYTDDKCPEAKKAAYVHIADNAIPPKPQLDNHEFAVLRYIAPELIESEDSEPTLTEAQVEWVVQKIPLELSKYAIKQALLSESSASFNKWDIFKQYIQTDESAWEDFNLSDTIDFYNADFQAVWDDLKGMLDDPEVFIEKVRVKR